MVRKILNSFSLAVGSIRSNIFHTVLSVLGIVIGVGALVSILSLIDGMERYAREQVSTTTSLNFIVIKTEQYRTINDVRIRKDSTAVLDFASYRHLQLTLSKPANCFFRFSEAGTINGRAHQLVGVNAFATDTSLVPGAKLVAGRRFNSGDMDQRRAVAIVNMALVSALKLDAESAMGLEITFKDMKLKIEGIMEDVKIPSPQIFFPITLISNASLKNNPADVGLMALNTEDVPKLKNDIEVWLKANYVGVSDDFRVLTNEFRVEQVARGFLLFRIIMGLIVGISVIVGGIGVMNVLLISVTERTSEIGIRKAMGANRRDIIFLFLTESVTVSAFGSLLGVIFGIVFTMAAIPIVKAVTKVPFQADYTLNTILVISVVALFVGIIFGTYPAIRASRLNPVDAIRHE
jgi:putative ABC transport system permease protein